MRTLVIGDIHGGLRALRQLLERACVDQDDHLIFLGDFVDGWSESFETVEFLMDLEQRQPSTFILGNHDELTRDWLLTQEENETWLMHGGEATRSSYLRAGRDRWSKHIEWIGNLRTHYLDNENRLFLHAGFTNLRGIEFEYFEKMLYWDRTLWELAKAVDPALNPEDEDYPERLRRYQRIFIGHTPLSKNGRAIPRKAANVWNVDTGAAFKGSLTALDIHTEVYWQSDPVHELYPGENGRNGR